MLRISAARRSFAAAAAAISPAQELLTALRTPGTQPRKERALRSAVADRAHPPPPCATVRDLLAAWVARAQPVSETTTAVVLARLLDNPQTQVDDVIGLLADKDRFRLKPTKQCLARLLNRVCKEITAAENDADKLDALDKLFKVFALHIHHAIAPDFCTYSTMIDACFRSGLDEGYTRAAECAAELYSLGFLFTPEALDAAVRSIAKLNLDKDAALRYIQLFEETSMSDDQKPLVESLRGLVE